jgi:hypothetical protein
VSSAADQSRPGTRKPGGVRAPATAGRGDPNLSTYARATGLAPHDLTWTGWVVLWVVWIWCDIESRHVATEAGISKGTLTGVASTLIARGLVARRVLLALTPAGTELRKQPRADCRSPSRRPVKL